MNWLSVLAPLLTAASDWLGRKLFATPKPDETRDAEAARRGTAAGAAAHDASRKAGPKP